MCSNDEIALTRMNHDVVYRDRRNVVFELRPRAPAQSRVEHSELCAGEKKIRFHEIFAYDLDGSVPREVSSDRSPMDSVVGALQDVRLEIIVAMVVESRVHGSLVESRRDDSTNIRLVGNARELRDPAPVCAAVARNRNHSVVSADV